MITVEADVVPIRQEADGTLRMGETRVLLELVIEAYDKGKRPETITRMYTTLRLADVYAVIAYYLNHREQIAEYLEQRELQAVEVRKKLMANQRDMSGLLNRLRAKRPKAE